MSGREIAGVPRRDARGTSWLFTALKLLAAVNIFAMAMLTFLDVIGRYVFSAPIQGTFEIVGLLLGVVAFSALPLVTWERSHITVDLFDNFFRGYFRKAQQLIVLIASAVTIAFFAERLYAAALDEAQANFVTEDLGISRAPLIYGLSGFSVITVLLLLVMIWRFVTGRLPVKPPSGHRGSSDENAP